MLTQTYVNLTYFFYPTGNTPAVNLLRDFHPGEQEHVNILSLACGDVRNVLFTLSNGLTPEARTTVDFTLCDYEPAVLARDLFLFTFLVKHHSAEDLCALRNIYYHLYITAEDSDVLKQHASELVSISGSSEDWCASRYGRIFKFVSESTLRELRRLWILYADADSCDERSVRAAITATMAKAAEKGFAHFGMRSAGLHGPTALATMLSTYKDFWSTGVVAGNAKDVQALRSGRGSKVNPLFALSSAPDGQFAVHYATDPLLGFHLAHTFDAADAATARSSQLAQTAKTEFNHWCRVFFSFAEPELVTMSFHCGEAIRFCHKMQAIANARPRLSAATYVYN